MTTQADAKQAVLRGVYEDNLGLPRSFRGKRRSPGAALNARGFGKGQKRVLAGLVALIGLLGCNFGAVYPDSFVSRSLPAYAAQNVSPAGVGAALYPALVPRQPPVAAAGPDPASTLLYGTASGMPEQYDAMLSHLDVPMADLFDLKVQTIVIDPGHGGYDPGAIGRNGLKEKDIALDIARRLREKLLAGGKHRVLLTRDEDRKVQLKERVAFAKQHHADLFISIHINSVAEEAGPVNYVETYYFGPHTDERSLALARKENRDSDYAMGDFREIISRIGDTLKTEESALLASAIHGHLYRNLKTHSSDLLDAGAKTGPFVVLLGVDVPSVLVEVSCISNRAEEARLGTPEYRDSVAAYLETGIVQYLKQRSIRNEPDGVNLQYVAQQER